MTRTRLTWWCLPCWLSAVVCLAAEDKSPPNVLLILADDVGCEVLGSYGGTSYATPHLDALAASGMQFRYCFSMPVCHPTRICLLTGRYPFRLQNPRWGTFPRQAERQTFAHAMKDAGYATAVAGKWQLTLMRDDPRHPQRLGFDESCLFGWHEGPRYHDPMIYQNGKVRKGLKGRYGPTVYTEFLIDFMKRHRDRPFLAFYSMALCHDVTDDLEEPVPYGPGKDHYDSYAEMVHQMDRHVGRLVEALEELGLRENTLILFTTDNGTSKRSIHRAENGKYVRLPVVSKVGELEVPGGKGDLTDFGTNVPLIASWPGRVAAGSKAEDLVDGTDFFATLIDLAGTPGPTGVALDGVSFAPRLLGEGESARRWAFAERGDDSWVRTRRWKRYEGGRLVEVGADRRERAVSNPEKLTGRAARQRQWLEAAAAQLGRP